MIVILCFSQLYWITTVYDHPHIKSWYLPGWTYKQERPTHSVFVNKWPRALHEMTSPMQIHSLLYIWFENIYIYSLKNWHWNICSGAPGLYFKGSFTFVTPYRTADHTCAGVYLAIHSGPVKRQFCVITLSRSESGICPGWLTSKNAQPTVCL